MLRPMVVVLCGVMLALSVCPTICLGNNRGSVGAYYAGREADRNAREAAEAWKSARKISRKPVADSYPEFSGNIDPTKMKTGDVGRFQNMEYEVIDVIDANNALIYAYSKYDDETATFWLVHPGVDLVNKDKIRVVDYVRVTGTKSYKAVRGNQMTVRVVELVPIPEGEELAKKEAEERQRQAEEYNAKEAAKLRDFRSWTAGSSTVQAKFVRLKSKSIVELQRQDGKKFEIRIKLLTPEHAKLALQLGAEDEAKRKAELQAKKEAKLD